MATIDGITYDAVSYTGDTAVFTNAGVIVARRNVLNGFDRTGYTEGFITPVVLAATNPLETTIKYTDGNAFVHNSATEIANTRYRTQVTGGFCGATLTVAVGNGTTTPLEMSYPDAFRVGDIFETAAGDAYEVVAIDGVYLTLDRDLEATISEGDSLPCVARKLQLFAKLASKAYAIGELVQEKVEATVNGVIGA